MVTTWPGTARRGLVPTNAPARWLLFTRAVVLSKPAAASTRAHWATSLHPGPAWCCRWPRSGRAVEHHDAGGDLGRVADEGHRHVELRRAGLAGDLVAPDVGVGRGLAGVAGLDVLAQHLVERVRDPGRDRLRGAVVGPHERFGVVVGRGLAEPVEDLRHREDVALRPAGRQRGVGAGQAERAGRLGTERERPAVLVDDRLRQVGGPELLEAHV